jgi:hypothetical protein
MFLLLFFYKLYVDYHLLKNNRKNNIRTQKLFSALFQSSVNDGNT